MTTTATLPSRVSRNGRPLTDKRLLETIPVGAPSWYGWPGYVVPTSMLRTVLEAHRDRMLNNQCGHPHFATATQEEWAELVTFGASTILRRPRTAATRRLYDVMNSTTRICTARNAEAFLGAIDLDLDLDTDIPTLPGGKAEAIDLLTIRARAVNPRARVRPLIHEVPGLLRLCASIVTDPGNAARYQDAAPFNCLRPWKDV